MRIHSGFASGLAAVAEEGHQRDERDRRDVLEEQDAERRTARRRVGLVPLGERLHRDGGGGERQREPSDQRAAPAEPEEAERGTEHGPARHELDHAAAQDRRAHGEEAARVELEADHEEHQHHAQLGEVLGGRDVAHEIEAPGTDRGARDEVAQDGAQAQARRDRHADHRGGEEDEGLDHGAGLAGCGAGA